MQCREQPKPESAIWCFSRTALAFLLGSAGDLHSPGSWASAVKHTRYGVCVGVGLSTRAMLELVGK